MTPLASILVVTLAGRVHLERLFPALAAQTMPDFEVVVVDNGSGTGAADLVGRLAPRARHVALGRNHGFAGGNAIGLSSCSGRYLALLNDDCVPSPTWLERALACSEREDAAMVATTMLRADDDARVDSAGIALDRVGIAWDRAGGALERESRLETWRDSGGFDRVRLDRRARESQAPVMAPLFGPSGGAALYRRDLIADVGFFAAEFESYYEDVELAWRARLRGWRAAHATDARTLHVGSATAGRNSPRKRYLVARNKLWTLARCAGGEGLAGRLIAAAVYDLAALAAYVALAPGPAVSAAARRAAARGRIDAIRGLSSQLPARRAIQAGQPDHAGALAAMAPIASPWAVARRFAHLPEGR